MFLCLGHVPLSAHFAQFSVLGWLHFPILEKWPHVGDIQWVPVAHSLLVTRAICSRGAPVGLPVPFCGRAAMVGVLVGGAGPQPGCEALPHVVAAGLLEGGVGFPAVCLALGLGLACWWAGKPPVLII